jgi:hypothetical protein
MANNKIYVSPGVYSKETDLSFATASIGVTTLGLAGETLKGAAFQPVAVQNPKDFYSKFGGQSPEKFSNGVPKYELPYIANEYLTQSNQLYVTRILGLSGYDAGKAWTITTVGGLDPATIGTVVTTGTTNFTGSTNSFSAGAIQALNTKFDNLPITALSSGSTFTVSTGSTLTYATGTFTAKQVALNVVTFSANTQGTATYTLTTVTGTPLTKYNNVTVATLRSRGSYVDGGIVYKTTSVASNGGAVQNAMNEFTLTTTNNSYVVSLDESKQSYITKVIGNTAIDATADIFVEDVYSKKLKALVAAGQVFGLTSALVAENALTNYKHQFKTPETPFIVSELRGNQVEKLFKIVSISDGDSANKEIKVSFENINFDTREFDIIVRDFVDSDTSINILEAFRRCSMNPTLTSFVGKRVGTTDELYTLQSNYIMIELVENAPKDAVPAGFEGYAVRAYTTSKAPFALYKTSYDLTKEKLKKSYLGISNLAGIDQNLFNNIGETVSTGTTLGFHMDVNANTAVYEVGNASFISNASVAGTDYETLAGRKFTVAPAGGFDGWDIYRTTRTNTDDFRKNQPNFSGFTESLPSDYYAYLAGIRTFSNPSDVDINLFATPGIDYDRQNALVKETIDMIEEERADSLYVVTTPDQPNDPASAEDSVDLLDAADIDSNYTTTYSPWVLHVDEQNGVNIFLPPTFEALRDFAETDKIKAPWFATAGYNRGQCKSKRSKLKINGDTSDTLYGGRINPIRTFSQSPLLIMGNKTLQVADSALNRINVRRLLLQVRKLVSVVAIRLVFEPNDIELQDQFKRLINPILADVKKLRGVIAFEVICDDSNNTDADRDQLQLNGTIRIKPTNAAEYIEITYGVTDQGAEFNNI